MQNNSPTFEDDVHLLVVEDSVTQAVQLQSLLERNGYRVTLATDSAEALSLMEKMHPTLVISDIVMPGMDGYELCRRVKMDAGTKDIPVILVTQLSEP